MYIMISCPPDDLIFLGRLEPKELQTWLPAHYADINATKTVCIANGDQAVQMTIRARCMALMTSSINDDGVGRDDRVALHCNQHP